MLLLSDWLNIFIFFVLFYVFLSEGFVYGFIVDQEVMSWRPAWAI